MPPKCQDCGACCFSDSDEYVAIADQDHDRLAEAGLGDYVTSVNGRLYMKMSRGRCAGLSIESEHFTCEIYPARPTVCRDLARGTPACASEFRDKRRLALALLRPAQLG